MPTSHRAKITMRLNQDLNIAERDNIITTVIFATELKLTQRSQNPNQFPLRDIFLKKPAFHCPHQSPLHPGRTGVYR